MSDQPHNQNSKLDREFGMMLESQRNLVESIKRIETKMDERHKERFQFEVSVREHMTKQGDYQELTEKHEDYFDLHVKPAIHKVTLLEQWNKECAAPAIEEINKIKYMVRGAALLASIAIAASWKEVAEFFKGIS